QNRVKRWDLTRGQELGALECSGRCYWVTFSPDGKLLASLVVKEMASQVVKKKYVYRVQLWDVTSGQERHSFTARCAPFSADRQIRALRDEAKIVRLFDLTRGQEVRALEGHGNSVNRVSFSPDGRRLGSVGGDWKVWDVPTGRPLFTLSGTGVYPVFNWDGK